MDNLEYSSENLIGFDYGPHGHHFSYTQGSTWPPASLNRTISQDISQNANSRGARGSTISGADTTGMVYAQQMPAATAAALVGADWGFDVPHPPQQPFLQVTGFDAHYQATYGDEVQTSPVALMPPTAVSFATAPVDTNLTSMQPNDPYMSASAPLEPMNQLAYLQLNNYSNEFVHMNMYANLPSANIGQPVIYGTSYTDSLLEVRSLSSSDNEWLAVDNHRAGQVLENYQDGSNAAIFNPGETLHHRTHSNCSLHSDLAIPGSAHSIESFEEVLWPISPQTSETNLDFSHYANEQHGLPQQSREQGYPEYDAQTSLASSAVGEQVALPHSTPSSASTSPASSGGYLVIARRKESPGSRTTKPVVDKKKAAQKGKKDAVAEKKVGKRKGPLRPDQRRQAGEIRKIKACLRCKFLKKTCDKGDPCGGCQPSHVRLWQVPCTRIDIKDINYFMKDWKTDFERHLTQGFNFTNIKGWSPHESPVSITHGYGYNLRISAREVYVRDDSCFNIDWVEKTDEPTPTEFVVNTARLTAGAEGISRHELLRYLDMHIDHGFERWAEEYFLDTPFVIEALKTAYRYYRRSNLLVVRKALKLVLAYALTCHITLIEGFDEDNMPGKIMDPKSKYYGQTAAPVMINFEIKEAMARTWRELQKEVLDELSSLYTGVYSSGEKSKNWPIIFILGVTLLIVWELMQYDCHYRENNKDAVAKFCNEMETVPVGVVVGLSSAISQKFPAFTQWETRTHAPLLGEDRASCEAMTEIRQHVTKYDEYLKKRGDCKFSRDDFDSLSGKFLSKLVIRGN